jgi:Transposase DDE domain
MVTIEQVASALQRVLTETAAAAAQQSGFMRRRSKLTGAAFVQTLVLGWLSAPDASLSDLAQTAAAAGVPISPQGLDQRFTESAATCLRQVLEAAVGTVLAADPVAVPIVERFSGVYLVDATTVSLPAALAVVWPGCGGRTPGSGAAALKVQVRLEVRSGALDWLELTSGRTQDHASIAQHVLVPADSLRIADLGYYSLHQLRTLAQAQALWLSRLHPQTVVRAVTGQRLDLVGWLRQQDRAVVDVSVQLGQQERLPARLLALRVPAAVAAERRRRMRAAAQREGRTVSADRLARADWTLLVTNVDAARLRPQEALVLYRLRWQIELLFKLWKSGARLATSRSQQPWRVLCEVYAKLVAVLVQHWLLLTGCWHRPDRSLPKAAATVRRFALALVVVLRERPLLRLLLRRLMALLATVPRLQSRRCHRATVHLLAEAGHAA